MGRRSGDKARATRQTFGGGLARGLEDGKTLVQLMADRAARDKYTDFLAAAGVSADRMALEVLYWLPQDFLDLYQELYMRGLRGTDGGTGDRGRAATETGELAKAARKTTRDGSFAGSGGGGKRYKKYWVVADERALELKTKIDKRLRSMTRDIRDELSEMDFRDRRGERPRLRVGRSGCPECGLIVSPVWMYCSRCGLPLIHRDATSDDASQR